MHFFWFHRLRQDIFHYMLMYKWIAERMQYSSKVFQPGEKGHRSKTYFAPKQGGRLTWIIFRRERSWASHNGNSTTAPFSTYKITHTTSANTTSHYHTLSVNSSKVKMQWLPDNGYLYITNKRIKESMRLQRKIHNSFVEGSQLCQFQPKVR